MHIRRHSSRTVIPGASVNTLDESANSWQAGVMRGAIRAHVYLCNLLGEPNPRKAQPAGKGRVVRKSRVIWQSQDFTSWAWNAKNKQEGQHQGPITAAYQRVLHAVAFPELQGRPLLPLL